MTGACYLGTDVGGTFTDLVFYTGSGEVHCFKVPSTPARPGASILEGIDEIRTALRLDAAVWRDMAHTHSSTVATNTLIERKGTRAGMIVTRGFRDLVERHGVPRRLELSSEVWAQAREYERGVLTAVNASIRPIVEGYIERLDRGLAERAIGTPARVARSNGGAELAATMRQRPVVALLSGPAAGVAGAAAAAADAGWEAADLMTLDVGGTSADIGVIRSGRPVLSSEEHIADFPLLIPTIAVSSIGAGGGSILWLDPTGSLKVGPRSVGADPGPACYGTSG